MRREIAFAALIALAVPAAAQEQDDEAMRAEAHRTIMRRLSVSGKAKTADLKLPQASAAFADLFLDLKRNKDDIRARRAPPSEMFMGTPHPTLAHDQKGIKYAACFVNLVIDEILLPYEEVVGLVKAALDPAFAPAVSIESDSKARIDAWRFEMVATLMETCFDRAGKGVSPLLKVESWPALRKLVVDTLLAAVPSTPKSDLYSILLTISTFGDEETAKALVRFRDGLPAGTEDWVPAMYTNCLCRIPCETTKAMIAGILDGKDEDAKSNVLWAIAFDPGDEITAKIALFFLSTGEEMKNLRMAAVQGLSNIKSAKAIGILRGALKAPASPNEELATAMALVNLDQEEAVPVLRKKLAAIEGDRNQAYWADRIKAALAAFEKRKGGDKGK